MLTRRTLLRSAAALSSVAAFERGFARHPNAIRLHVPRNNTVTHVPGDFTGLGYEMSSVARPNLFDSRNKAHVQLIRNLGSKGVLRLGGIVADFTSYSEAGPPRAEPKNTVVTHADLERLRGFLDEVGWKAIWSLNFGRGTLPQALIEVKAVAGILGDRLQAIELGNEVENYGRQRTSPPASLHLPQVSCRV